MGMNSASPEFIVVRKDSKTKARIGAYTIGNIRLETPTLWFGYCFDSPPKLWDYLHIDSVMVNAYEILSDESRLLKIENTGINSYLGFDGPIAIDSGGFLLQKRASLFIDVSRLLEMYERTRPTIGVVLDHPLSPFVTRKENETRWTQTLENTRQMLARKNSIPLMPVVHGYTLDDIARACDAIEELSKVDIIGIGSLVPLMKGINRKVDFPEHYTSEPALSQRKSARTSKYSSRHFVVDAIRYVRERFPDALLHVFGVGGTTTMHLMLALGVDSIDSIGWRLKAGHGAIQLPGIGDRFLKPRNDRKTIRSRRVMNDIEKEVLSQCACPTCAGLTLSKRIEMLDQSFEKRALHNAWVYLKELRQFKQCVKAGVLSEFLAHRLKSSPFKQFSPIALECDKVEVELKDA